MDIITIVETKLMIYNVKCYSIILFKLGHIKCYSIIQTKVSVLTCIQNGELNSI